MGGMRIASDWGCLSSGVCGLMASQSCPRCVGAGFFGSQGP